MKKSWRKNLVSSSIACPRLQLRRIPGLIGKKHITYYYNLLYIYMICIYLYDMYTFIYIYIYMYVPIYIYIWYIYTYDIYITQYVYIYRIYVNISDIIYYMWGLLWIPFPGIGRKSPGFHIYRTPPLKFHCSNNHQTWVNKLYIINYCRSFSWSCWSYWNHYHTLHGSFVWPNNANSMAHMAVAATACLLRYHVWNKQCSWIFK